MEAKRSCSKVDPCPYEIQDRSGHCCFPHPSISPLSDITCRPMPSPIVIDGVGDPSLVPDMTKPIVVNWSSGEPAPTFQSSQKVCIKPTCDTDETFKLVSKVVEHPEGGLITQTLNHPLCPDAQLTLTITPPVKKPMEIRIPECKVPPVRPPQRPWLQCIENQRISDKVRRPLARVCHRRELPPVVISSQDYIRIQAKATERERKKAEQEARCMERECERLKSRYRHSLWNYTVESLLESKRKEQKEKEDTTMVNDKTIMAELRAETERESVEARQKAQKMMLYRKGLIRDFHSAMATSKLMKETEAGTTSSNQYEEQIRDSPPFLNKICLQKMAWVNYRPEYEKQNEKKPCSKQLIELVKLDENRVAEREMALREEKYAAEALRTCEQLPYTEAYLKHIQEPACEPDEDQRNEKLKKQSERRRELFEDIQDRLCLDAFIESREKEQERQAKCFNHYVCERTRLVKEKEKQLIEDKVKRNIEASEKAAAVLVEMQSRKQGRADVYNELKDQWETEFQTKASNKKKEHGKRMGLVYKDFWERRNAELCKRQLIDASRHWVREQMTAQSNYEMECELNATRKEKAEELALYHKAQIADKKCREDKARHLDCVYGYKAKMAHEAEEKEMRDYAQTCMEEWASKGRPLKPMVQAMKKWDFEGGMYPHQASSSAQCLKPDGNGTSGGSNYETSANRLGFGTSGT